MRANPDQQNQGNGSSNDGSIVDMLLADVVVDLQIENMETVTFP